MQLEEFFNNYLYFILCITFLLLSKHFQDEEHYKQEEKERKDKEAQDKSNKDLANNEFKTTLVKQIPKFWDRIRDVI